MLLLFFQLLPVDEHLVRAVHVYGAEHVRMAEYHLVRNARRHVAQCERGVLLLDHNVERYLQKQIAQLLAKVVRVVPVDGVDHFPALLQQALFKALMRLLGVPGTAARRAQAPHHLHKPLDGVAGEVDILLRRYEQNRRRVIICHAVDLVKRARLYLVAASVRRRQREEDLILVGIILRKYELYLARGERGIYLRYCVKRLGIGYRLEAVRGQLRNELLPRKKPV